MVLSWDFLALILVIQSLTQIIPNFKIADIWTCLECSLFSQELKGAISFFGTFEEEEILLLLLRQERYLWYLKSSCTKCFCLFVLVFVFGFWFFWAQHCLNLGSLAAVSCSLGVIVKDVVLLFRCLHRWSNFDFKNTSDLSAKHGGSNSC